MTNTHTDPILYVLNVGQFADQDLFDRAYKTLDKTRKEKTDRLRFTKDQYLSTGAGLLLKYALRQCGITEYRLRYNRFGKPFLSDQSLFFNISHCEDYVICAISRFEIGCDIENIKNSNTDIAKRFFHQSEWEDILSSKDPERQFIRYWTLKESFIKATGFGMSVPLRSFCIKIGESISVSGDFCKNEYSFYEYCTDDRYGISVCTEKDSPKPKVLTKTVEQLLEEMML